MSKKIYLAIPYSGICKQSFETANQVAAQLMHEGNIVFSPISHSHSISEQCKLPTNWEFWMEQDEAFIQWCDEVYVVLINSNGRELIESSVGVQGELLIAKQNNKPVRYIGYNNIDKWEIQ